MNYSVSYSGFGGAGLTNYGEISAAAAMARARRLSRSVDSRASARKWNPVTLFGTDEDGDRAHYQFLNGKLIAKKITYAECD